MITATELNELSIEELRSLNKLVIQVIENKKQIQSLDVKSKLYVGAKVKVNHQRLAGKNLTIEKINRTKAIVKEEGAMGAYDVPFSMIELI